MILLELFKLSYRSFEVHNITNSRLQNLNLCDSSSLKACTFLYYYMLVFSLLLSVICCPRNHHASKYFNLSSLNSCCKTTISSLQMPWRLNFDNPCLNRVPKMTYLLVLSLLQILTKRLLVFGSKECELYSFNSDINSVLKYICCLNVKFKLNFYIIIYEYQLHIY